MLLGDVVQKLADFPSDVGLRGRREGCVSRGGQSFLQCSDGGQRFLVGKSVQKNHSLIDVESVGGPDRSGKCLVDGAR